jgi:Ca2+-binding RTX toxin-like protein
MVVQTGTQGADTLKGSTGDDVMFGKDGTDAIVGQEGSDLIFGGSGNDKIAGDNFVYYVGRDPDDYGYGSSHDYGPYWNSAEFQPGHNLIFAGAGNDTVLAGFGADTVFGGAGDDVIIGYGAVPTHGAVTIEDRTNFLFGGSGNDSIEGGAANDHLYGGAGRDVLTGSGGVDTLTGGAGHDIFKFGRVDTIYLDTGVGPGQRDIIADFHHGQDKLDLTGYHNTFSPPQGQPNSLFLGTRGFEASFAVQVRYDIVDGNTVVQVSSSLGYRNADDPPTVPTGPNEEIELRGIHHLTADDFILPPGTGDYAPIA